MNKIYQEHPTDTWSSNGVYYNLNKILKIAHDKEAVEMDFENFRPNVKDYKSINNGGILVCESCYEQDPKKAHINHIKRTEEADLSIPIIVYKDEGKNKWRVIDGQHRVEKALNKDLKKMKVKILSKEELEKAKI